MTPFVRLIFFLFSFFSFFSISRVRPISHLRLWRNGVLMVQLGWTLDWEGYLFNEYALKRIPFSNLAVCLVFQVSTSFSSKDTWEADEQCWHSGRLL